MKIKTLAIAAATLAVGAISSQAQVYSQNIVGYVNSAAPSGEYNFWCNPLTTGNDVLTNIFHNVPGGTTLQIWNGNGYNSYTFNATGGHWKNGAAIVDNTNLPPGVGYFIEAPSPWTNTFTGQIAVNSGSSITNSLTGAITPVGSVVPFGDVVTNGATINLQVAGGSTLQKWSVSGQTFTAFTFNGTGHNWKIGSLVTNPPMAVGEGFFIQASSATNWVQTSP